MSNIEYKPTIVTLVQITEPQQGYSYLPYTAALLEAYIKGKAESPERYLFTLPVFERLPLEDNLSQLASANVVGLSIYLWNSEYTLALSAALKAQRPNVRIIAGGPMIPDDASQWQTVL